MPSREITPPSIELPSRKACPILGSLSSDVRELGEKNEELKEELEEIAKGKRRKRM